MMAMDFGWLAGGGAAIARFYYHNLLHIVIYCSGFDSFYTAFWLFCSGFESPSFFHSHILLLESIIKSIEIDP